MKTKEITRRTFLATLAKRPILNQAYPYRWIGKRKATQRPKCRFMGGIHIREDEAAILGVPAGAALPQFVGLFQDKHGRKFVVVGACQGHNFISAKQGKLTRFFKIQLQ